MSAALGVGAGASVVGGLMQAIAAGIARQKMQDEFAREMQLQQGLRNQGLQVFQPQLQQKGVESARTQIAQGAQGRQSYYQQTAASPLGIHTGATQRTRAADTLSGQNRANLGGYSDWQLHQAISHIRSQDEINRLTNFAGGWEQVFPYRLNDAEHSQDQLAFLGNLVSSVGGSAQGWGQIFGGAPQGGANYRQTKSPGGAGYSPDFYERGPQ